MKLRFPLRDWQREAVEAWRENGRCGIVEVVTGGGKTVFAEACMLNAIEAHPELRVVIVVPTLALVDQWHVSLQEELGVAPEEIATFSGRKRAAFARFNLMVINTARTLAPKIAEQHRCMLVVDECHRAGSERNSSALKGAYVATLGLSATPERQYDDALAEAIVPALGPIVYSYDLIRARQDGVVTSFRLANVEIGLLVDEQAKYERLTNRIARKLRGRDPDAAGTEMTDDVAVLLQRRARVTACATMRIPVTVKLAEKHRGHRLMIFHEDIDSLMRIADALKARRHSVTVYHTRISPVRRRANLRLYRQGIYDVMASCHALDEGINIPEIEVAIIASATATTRQRIQRLGRVLRPSRGKVGAIVYTLFATKSERDRLVSEAQALEGTADVTWLRVGGGDESTAHKR